MKKYISILFVLPALIGCTWAQEPTQSKYADLITEGTSKEHLTILASQEFAGRGTAQEGGRKAVDYIVKEFQKYGLKTVNNDSYLQPLSLMRTSYVVDEFKIGNLALTYNKDFIVQGENTKQSFSADEIVFIGYGIQDEKYNDLEGLQVEGKVVFLINEGEPKDAQGNSLISGSKSDSEWSKSRLKRLQNLVKQSPKLILGTGSNIASAIQRMQQRPVSGRYGIGKVDEVKENNTSPFVLLTESAADQILALQKTSLQEVKQKITTAGKPNSFVIHSPFVANMGVANEQLDDPNVVGLLEGTDLKDEIVVIGGHYDHEGIAADGTYFPGADDNGSGTVAVLETARAFAEAKKAGKGPRRSILFITYAAEERGLLGSKYYVQNPLLPLAQTVACLNVDMIGRIDDKHLDNNHNYVHVIGTNKLSSDLNPIVENANQLYTKMELDGMYNDPNDPQRLYYRSDHYNFAKEGIPSLFFFSGLHPHYHTPDDTVDKIDFPMMVKREKLIFHVTWDIANRDARLVVDIPEETP